MSELRRLLLSAGVTIHEHSPFTSFETRQGRATAAVTGTAVVAADEFVVATGAWTPLLAKELGTRLPIQPGKGGMGTVPEGRSLEKPVIPQD